MRRLERRRRKWARAQATALTYFKNTCTALCPRGSTVASNRGRKMFSKILAKCGINFFDLKMSLHNQTTKFRGKLSSDWVLQPTLDLKDKH